MPDVVGGEDVLRRLQGFKDPRSKIGEMARGKNMYPGGNAARTGGGPDIGRPPESQNPPTSIPPEAAQAVLNYTQNVKPVPPAPTNLPNQLPALQNKLGAIAAPPSPAQALTKRQAGSLSKEAMRAAAQRRMQR